jgi:integrase
MKINKLNIKQVENTKKTLGDGGGLYFRINKAGGRKWVFRGTLHGKVFEMGLGGSLVSLAVARRRAADARELVAAGINPVAAKRENRIAAVPKPTFGDCALALIKAKHGEWRSEKHREQWRVTLETHAAALWATPVDQVDTAAVLGVLTQEVKVKEKVDGKIKEVIKPFWQATRETASRLRGRIEAVLDYAKAHGWRSGENPAAWRGHLALILPKRGKFSRGHHAAMPYDDVPAFMAGLRDKETMPSLALEFLILTAARSGEVLGARWAEIDRDAKVWTVPAARMKAGVEHRVPLSAAAMEILERLAGIRTGELLFTGQRRGGQLSNSGVALIVPDGATIHGFRSAFRDWCGNETNFPRELAEAALAHRTGDSTEQAYRRGDALEKRRALMESWAAFCGPVAAGVNVVPLRQVQ